MTPEPRTPPAVPEAQPASARPAPIDTRPAGPGPGSDLSQQRPPRNGVPVTAWLVPLLTLFIGGLGAAGCFIVGQLDTARQGQASGERPLAAGQEMHDALQDGE
ncbi:hypothetical protein GCM10027059_49370 [Myceligenerans halotolerans]